MTQNTLLDEQLGLLKLLPTPLPPQFLQVAGYTAESRFIGLWYHATQSNLSDGQITRPVSFYRVYAPLVQHTAVSIYVRQAGADLGSDDSYPTHALLLDTKNERIYLGTFESFRRASLSASLRRLKLWKIFRNWECLSSSEAAFRHRKRHGCKRK